MSNRYILMISFIALFTALSFSSHAETKDKEKKVLVVGAGILGASVAYHLSLTGNDVTVIDMQGPASHSSRGTFAWINASWAKQPQNYHALNQQSTAYWHTLAKELNIPIKFTGSLEWFDSAERQKRLITQIEEQNLWSEPARILSIAEAKKREPKVNFGNTEFVASSPRDGAVDPVLATRQFLDAAAQRGAKIQYPCKLASIAQHIANTSCGEIVFDQLVLAVGASSDIIKTVAHVDIKQRTTPGIIVITKPMPALLNGILVAPGVHIHQRLDGRIVLGEQAGTPDTQAHKMRLADRPNDYPNTSLALDHAQRIIQQASIYLPEMSAAQVEDVFIGWRPLPLDGHPVLGFSDSASNVYIAVTHSGVTLAPILGKLIAQELNTQEPLAILNEYRPSREFTSIKRY